MFLLVPAHPGFPGQIPQSRKTVVCCVCVVVLLSDFSTLSFYSSRKFQRALKLDFTSLNDFVGIFTMLSKKRKHILLTEIPYIFF